MSRRPQTSLSTLLALVTLVCVLALILTGPASAGLVFTQETKGEGEAAKYQNSTMRIWIDTGGAKMEFLSSGNPMMPEGSYMLVQPDADAMLLVNPKEKTYSSLDFSQIMGSMSQMMGGASQGAPENASERKAPDPIVEKLLEEDGGTILGRPTRHFRWRTRYTVPMTRTQGFAMDMSMDQTEDVWVADFKIDPRIMRSFERMGGGASLPKEMQKVVEAAKQTQTGFPLKRIVVATSKSTASGSDANTAIAAQMIAHALSKHGREDQQRTTTIEVTELKEEKIPASMFSIPAGYTETEMLAPAMKMPDMSQQH